MKKLILLTLTTSLIWATTICTKPKPYIVKDNAQESRYKNCVRNGMTYWYKDDGSIKSKVNFTDGKENGLYTSYHTNGQEKIVVHYVDA